MIDTLLTILGVSLYIPFLIQLCRTRWTCTTWSRRLLQLSVMLQMTSLFHLPSVMYCCAGLQLVVLLVYWLVERPAFRWTSFMVMSLLYVVYFAVAILWSPLPKRGGQFLIDNGLPMIGYALTASIVPFSKDEWTTVLKTFCYAGLVFIGLALVSWGASMWELHVAPQDWPMLRKEKIGDLESYRWLLRCNGGLMGYAHPSYDLLPVFAAACIGMWLGKIRGLHPSVSWILWSGSMVLTLLSQSRMGLTYAVIVLVFGVLYFLPTLRSRLVTGIGIAVIGITLLTATHGIWKPYSEDPIRGQLYSYTWRYIEAKPWTGAGTGALNPIEMCHTIDELYWPHVGFIAPDKDISDWRWKTHMLPHNQWIADWAHAGIGAALVTLLLYLCMIVECSRKRIYWGLVFLLIFIIFSCLEPPLYIGKGLYLFGSLCAFFHAYPKCEQ